MTTYRLNNKGLNWYIAQFIDNLLQLSKLSSLILILYSRGLRVSAEAIRNHRDLLPKTDNLDAKLTTITETLADIRISLLHYN